MFPVVFALVLTVSIDDEPGFGGAANDDAAAPEAEGDVGSREFRGSAAPAPTDATDVTEEMSAVGVVRDVQRPKRTKLEEELERARLDPARFPLLRLRVDVARLVDELAEAEGRGLSAAREVENRLAAARALLMDVERIALHRMNVCAVRTGRGTRVRNFRMTPAGPVRLTTAEMLAQASALDPDGCSRLDLVDQALVDRVRRARDIKILLATTSFPYHRVAERRALEDELRALEKDLAKEDLPVVSFPGARDPYGR